MSKAFGIRKYPVTLVEHRELLIAHNVCPECCGDLDSRLECFVCSYEAAVDVKGIDLQEYRKSEYTRRNNSSYY